MPGTRPLRKAPQGLAAVLQRFTGELYLTTGCKGHVHGSKGMCTGQRSGAQVKGQVRGSKVMHTIHRFFA